MPTCTTSERRPEQTPLYRLLQDHLASFLLAAERRDDRALPRFVRKALTAHLRCGVLSLGFARYRCPSCKHEHLSAHSCKARGLCPSCDGRRMTQLAAHLTDHVFPHVPTRQWVLTFPHALRYRLAYDHALLNAVHVVVARALSADYARRARRDPRLSAGRKPQTGFVTFIQRFGSALNLNLHFHIHAIDGVFVRSNDGAPTFLPTKPPSPEEMQALAETIRTRVLRLLYRRGVLEGESSPDPLHEDSPQLAACYAASIRNTSALTSPGRRLLRIRRAERRAKPFTPSGAHGHADGFDLHANLTVRAGDRTRLERILRYIARPALANERLKRLADGSYTLKLKTPWHDGTSHLRLHPHEVIERLAALIPKPHKNLLHYSGVLAPNHKWRKHIVAFRAMRTTPRAPDRNPSWAELMRRSFAKDPLACPHCGTEMRFIANLLEHKAITRFLRHLGLHTEPPQIQPARAPPQLELDLDHVA